jgi:hypothetical protein
MSSVGVFLPDSEDVSSSRIRVEFDGMTRSGNPLTFFVEFVRMENGVVDEDDGLLKSLSESEASKGVLPS